MQHRAGVLTMLESSMTSEHEQHWLVCNVLAARDCPVFARPYERW